MERPGLIRQQGVTEEAEWLVLLWLATRARAGDCSGRTSFSPLHHYSCRPHITPWPCQDRLSIALRRSLSGERDIDVHEPTQQCIYTHYDSLPTYPPASRPQPVVSRISQLALLARQRRHEEQEQE